MNLQTETDPFLKKINELQTSYYSQNSKNLFFKQTQKTKCAEMISSNFTAEELLRNCCYQIPNTNQIYFNYLVFKTFAQPDNYDIIINYLIQIINNVLFTYPYFEAHFNINSFTVSAAHRYKECIILFLTKCSDRIPEFSNKLNTFNVYYSPACLESIQAILLPLIPVVVRSKMRTFNKDVSAKVLLETCKIES
jgi:hypothetical protein